MPVEDMLGTHPPVGYHKVAACLGLEQAQRKLLILQPSKEMKRK